MPSVIKEYLTEYKYSNKLYVHYIFIQWQFYGYTMNTYCYFGK